MELLRGFDDRFSPSCCIPNLTDSRAFSVFLLSERLKRSSMRTQATQTDTSKRNGVVPNQSHILNLQKVSVLVLAILLPRTEWSLETLLQVSMISEGVQTNGGLSNGYPSPPQPPLPVLHQQHQGCTLIFNDISLSRLPRKEEKIDLFNNFSKFPKSQGMKILHI